MRWWKPKKSKPSAPPPSSTILVLSGCRSQPERCQGRLGQVPGLFGSFPGGAEDDEVVAIADQHPQSPSHPVPRLVEDVEGDVGEQG